MKNRGSTPILTNLVRVHPRNIHTKFEANPCSSLIIERRRQKSLTAISAAGTDPVPCQTPEGLQYSLIRSQKHYTLSKVNPLERFFSLERHAALDRNPGLGYNTVTLAIDPKRSLYCTYIYRVVSASHAVGHGFVNQPGHTKDYHNKSDKCHCGCQTKVTYKHGGKKILNFSLVPQASKVKLLLVL